MTKSRRSVRNHRRFGNGLSRAIAESLEGRQYFASYFVDASALTNGNGSTGSPFKTIQAAANVVSAGDDVNVRPGTYNEKVVVSRSGAAGKPITFRASGGVVTVTSAAVAMWQSVIDIRGDHITFDGINVRDSNWYGYKIEGNSLADRTTNVTIKNALTQRTFASGIFVKIAGQILVLNNKIQDACISPVSTDNTQECITFTETDGFEIAGNEIWNSIGNNGPSNGGEGIDAKGSSSNGLIRDNLIRDLGDTGIYLDSGSKQGTGTADDRPMANITVTRNIVRNVFHGIALASELGGTAQNISISNNLVYDCLMNGIVIAGWNDNGPRNGVLIANNTVYRCGFGNVSTTWGGGIDVQTANYTNIRILNNIASGNESWQIARTANANAPAGQLTVAGNVSFGPSLTYWFPVIGTPGLNQDPQFVNPAAGDFRLRSTSSAINFGVATEAPTVDLQNLQRFAAPDAGAYEFVPSAPASLSLTLASDTGVAGDSRTRLNNATPAQAPSFTITGVLAGSTVRVFAGDVQIGSAVASGTILTLTTNGATTIPDGSASITATQTFAGAPSTSSGVLAINVDSKPPSLVGTPAINTGAGQAASRSQVRTITWTLSEPVTAFIGSFVLKNMDTGAQVSLASRIVSLSGNVVTVDLDRPGVDSGSALFLPDANYELALLPSTTDTAGNTIDANNDGVSGETARFRFFKLQGDFNGDRRVSNADFLIWKSVYNRNVGGASSVDPAFDLNGSGRVTNADYLIWKTRFNRRVATMADGLLFS